MSVCVQVCVIEPLCFSSCPAASAASHPARDLLMLAMASLSKLLIVTLRPDLRVTYLHALCGDPQTLPLLAWHFVTVQLSDKCRAVDPVLAFARDQTVYFVQVCGRVVPHYSQLSAASPHCVLACHIKSVKCRQFDSGVSFFCGKFEQIVQSVCNSSSISFK